MKKILITGATGFLGSRLVEKMSIINGLDILATGRTLKTKNISKKPNLEYVLGNLEDTKFMDSLTSGIDAIIHTAALSSQMGNPKDFQRTNIEVTKQLLKAAKAKGVSYFKNLSELNQKESPRLKWGEYILNQMDIKTISTNDSIKIFGNPKLKLNKKIIIKNYLKDHRVFMTCIIAALSFGGEWDIHDKDSIKTSFPNFLKIVNQLKK